MSLFRELDRMFGRGLVFVNMLGILMGVLISIVFGFERFPTNFSLSLGMIISGFCAGFAGYVQITTLKATGLYDDVESMNPVLKES